MTDEKKLKAMAEYLAKYLDKQLDVYYALDAGAILSGIKDFKLAFDVAKIQFMADDKQYRAEQFLQVITPCGRLRLRICRPEGQVRTDWLSISENELQAIIELLT